MTRKQMRLLHGECRIGVYFMKICCFGSLNNDFVYQVRQFVQAGETIHSFERKVICGGKGLNQSVAMARSGAQVFHAGNVGAADGADLIDTLKKAGADVSLINLQDVPSGHAIIQVDQNGENCILLYSGANTTVSAEQIERVMSCFEESDLLVLQNEINALPEIMKAAHEKKMQIVLNPSPVEGIVGRVPLELVNYLFVNEKEACQIGGEATPQESVAALRRRYPDMTIICTLGSRGAELHGKENMRMPAVPAEQVRDTTGAGDTFLGYFVGSLACGRSMTQCMRSALAAATLCVGKEGASASIPCRKEVDALVEKQFG